MEWKQFFDKNKKIISIIFIIFTSILMVVAYLIIENKNKKREKLEKKEEMFQSIPSSYNKLIPFDEEISDLKYFTNLTPLQKDMLLLMKENFITLTTDWNKSIQEKKAEYKNDFKQTLQDNELKPVLKPSYSLGLLGSSPKDENHQIHNIEGYDNFYKLNDKLSKQWYFELKNDLKFANGKEINNQVVVYSLKKQQEITRLLYKDEDLDNLEKNIKLLFETNFIYDSNNPLMFTLSYENPKTLKSVIILLNSCILFPQDDFELAYDKNNAEQNNYGTKEYPFISYGPYQLKTEQGYNSEKDWIFTKNNYFHNKEQYPLCNIEFKKLSSEKEQYDKEKYHLFNEGKINEIILDISDISNISPEKKENLLAMSTSVPIHVFFNKYALEEEKDEIIKKQKEKSNFFLNDPRFRKALFLSLNRDLLGKNDYFGLIPSFSFVSDVTLFTDYDFFNEQDFHQKNLDKLIEIETEQKTTMDNNKKFYQPTEANKLLKQVHEDFKQNFPQNNEPLIIKILDANDYGIKEKKLTEFLISNWEKVFPTNSLKFEKISEGDFNINIDSGIFEIFKNPHNIFIYILDEIKLPNGNSRNFILTKQINQNYDNDIIIKIDQNYDNDIILIEKKLDVNELKKLLDELQKKIDQPNNNQRSVDLSRYSNILKQLEQKTFEELLYLPLIKGKRYKIYKNLKSDFVNSFILWGLNDVC
ncbi:MAG: ABC transporter substrate-binding protein [Candidatus Phytoplasma vitis]|nr:MAG: ABC transporter substrate-binding protein [Candidatus Phytoplasma vitis]